MEKVKTVVYKVNDFMCWLANIFIFLNMMIVVISVVGRIVFNQPILGLTDIVTFVFGLSAVFAFSITEKNKMHITMDLLQNVLPRKGKLVDHIITSILTLVTLGIITVVFFQYTATTFANNMVSWTVRLPYWPFVLISGISMVIFFLTALFNFFNYFAEYKEGKV